MSLNQTPILCTENVTVDFSGFKAIKALDFSMQKGTVHFLIGPNGAGKTHTAGCDLREGQTGAGERVL